MVLEHTSEALTEYLGQNVPSLASYSVNVYIYTRSYYRKENAASPPRDEGSMRNLLNKGPVYMIPPGRDMRQDDFDIQK